MEVFKTVLDLGEKKLRENEKAAKEKALKFDTTQRVANVITFCYQQTALIHTYKHTHTYTYMTIPTCFDYVIAIFKEKFVGNKTYLRMNILRKMQISRH